MPRSFAWERKGTTLFRKKPTHRKKIPNRYKNGTLEIRTTFYYLWRSQNKSFSNILTALPPDESTNPAIDRQRPNQRRPEPARADERRRPAPAGAVQQRRKTIQPRADRIQRVATYPGQGQFCSAGDGGEGNGGGGGKPGNNQAVPVVHAQPNKPSVFISYNQRDDFAMRAVKRHLEDHEIDVFVDSEDLESAGDTIQGFIDKALRENKFIISIISRNSLLSGVAKELSSATLLNQLGTKKWIPVAIDNSWSDPDFYFEAQNHIGEKIKESTERMKRALDANLDTSPFQDELKRQRDLQANLGSVLEISKRTLVTDITGPLFEVGMRKVVNAINS
ncbi:MAG: toll/interleukin-1 receptor domain-containing protein [Lewinellaceae bacterium]|nr:toll/interleukin-1 receptor domain-containing protein [Lewinellaceae bacterium]